MLWIGSPIICLGDVPLCVLALLYRSLASLHMKCPRVVSWHLYYSTYTKGIILVANICSHHSFVHNSKLSFVFLIKDIVMVIEHLTEDQKDDRCLVLHQPSANQSRQDKVLSAGYTSDVAKIPRRSPRNTPRQAVVSCFLRQSLQS